MAQYVGILDGAGDVWGVRIPDFPGCNGGGPTAEDALKDAINALREVAAHYVSEGRAVPSPRTMDEIRRDEDVAYDPGSESMVMVPLLLDKARPFVPTFPSMQGHWRRLTRRPRSAASPGPAFSPVPPWRRSKEDSAGSPRKRPDEQSRGPQRGAPTSVDLPSRTPSPAPGPSGTTSLASSWM